MSLFLTAARQSVWDAIDNYSGTAEAFRQTIRYDGDLPAWKDGDDNPTTPDLPCIALFPASATPRWYINKGEQTPYTLTITIWTARWELSDAENLVDQVRNAIYQAAPPGSSIPYVRNGNAACTIPEVGPALFQKVILGEGSRTKAIRVDMQLVLKLRDQPLTVG